MESEENSQLCSHEEKNNDNKNQNNTLSKKTHESESSKKKKNSINKDNKEEIEVELILKKNTNDDNEPKIISQTKTDSLEDKTNNKELILPKIETNNSLKSVQENNINIISNKRLNLEDEININNIEKEKESSNIPSSIIKNIENETLTDRTSTDRKKQKEEKILKTFNKLKNALMLACVEIEENLNKIYYPEKTEEMMNLSHVNVTKSTKFTQINDGLLEEQKSKEKEIFKKIKNYKLKIKSLQNELDIELGINKADELELLYSEKKAYLEKLKKENNILKNFNNKDEKNQQLINIKKTNKIGLISINEKINKIKVEIKIQKDYCKTLIDKIKLQNERIQELQSKHDLINENIEYYKKKQNKELKKQKEENIINNNSDEEEMDIDTIRKNYEVKYNKIKDKEEKIKSKVKEQNIKVNGFAKNNEKLSENIKEIVKEIKDKTSQIITYENKIRIKEMKIYNRLNKKNNTLIDKKPFHIAPINSNKIKTKKIFDYEKYLKNYENGNKNKIRLYTSADINRKPQALNEIEKLKTDIQQTIKKNELDEKIKKIIIDLKKSGYNKYNTNDEEDDLQKFLKRNEEINYRDRYNFYVTEGANLPVPIKAENINNNLFSKY